MKTLKILMLALVCAISLPLKADEGMWLLQMMQEKHLTDRLKAQGLLMETDDVYSPNKISLKDAVGIFGGGCTGEIISPDGLILTNHHCGYGAIQQHSSVEHDYLKYGFWAKNRSEELATPGLAFTFVERIVDVTDKVFAQIKSGEIKEEESFGQPYLRQLAKKELEASDLNGKPGIRTQALPFYAGNKYYVIYLKTYKDVRMVAAPPSSIGKFGGETDNWMWPRHTCDFSVFRVYADANGEPADYSPNNVPLKAKKHLAISLKGIEEGDYAMIMGFPGSTNRYLTQSEIKQRMTATNEPRIRIRGARQEVLKAEMYASDKIRIQYASKYAGSSNYWKNSIGMNKAIVDNKVLETKAEQEARFAKFAQEKDNSDYAKLVSQIDAVIEKSNPILYQFTC
ncbi:MAG: S46 family peptidase, partial [Bacteroides sp.]|nr:S46 family peptidase [Bacteroides sp.]